MSTLSSKVARKAPSGRLKAFLTCPRIPDTVRIFAPSNFATSIVEVNISRMNAVFLNTFIGVPVNLSFLTISVDESRSRTTPVAAIRNRDPAASFCDTLWTAQNPVLAAVSGPKKVAKQCMCSGVYLSILLRVRESDVEYIGIDWNRRQPSENIRGSLVLRIFLCHRCRFIRA